MGRDSILPPHATDFWIKRWFFGVILPTLFLIFGMYSILTEHSYAMGRTYRRLSLVEVTGFQAILMGVAFLGGALALFSYCYVTDSERFSSISKYGVAGGLFCAAVGVCWCSWIFLAG
jgi:hypothetical protein